ncbi:MAG: tRNA pseudouridine(55) synthase TruB [Armatimonadetes bacterium]|nr:tRNA pseudouridine(55) synthase TruB [Armatimonadota bacterium]
MLRDGPGPLGVLLINKPPGITSHDVVQQVRRKLNTRRVGHAGTLDPIATGLLVIAVGPATRFLQYLPLEPKEYECTFLFGQETSTYDAEGEVTSQCDVPDDLGERVTAALPRLRGPIEQLPPLYSAVKKAGKPLYAYARKGEEVEREPRRVFVETFETLNLKPPQGEFRIVCSGGTYVRTLAQDLGQAVGCGAHVVELQRTRVGRFDIDDSVELENVTESALMPLETALDPMPMIRLNEGQLSRVMNGQWIKPTSDLPAETVGLLNEEGRLVSIARLEGNLLHPQCVLPAEVLHDAV